MPRNRRENPVVLSRIYTRTGDDGSTALADNTRTDKTDSRLVAYADVEEANCAIGVALALGRPGPEHHRTAVRIQNELFDVGADLANPITDEPPPYPPLRIDDELHRRPGRGLRPLQRGPSGAAQLRAARRDARRGPAAHRAGRHPAGRTERLGGGRRARRFGQPAGRAVPEPPVGPAVHPRADGQRRTRRRALEARRRGRAARAAGGQAIWSMYEPGGAASSQDRKPVRAASDIASSTRSSSSPPYTPPRPSRGRGWRSRPGWPPAATTTDSVRRSSSTRGRSSTPNRWYQHSRSPW